jgi:hypothetical protein
VECSHVGRNGGRTCAKYRLQVVDDMLVGGLPSKLNYYSTLTLHPSFVSAQIMFYFFTFFPLFLVYNLPES